MDPVCLEFLRRYLDAHPSLREIVRLDPPAVAVRGRWTPIRHLRLSADGLECSLPGKKKAYLIPARAKTSARESFRISFLELLRRRFPTWKICKVLSGTDRLRHHSAAMLRVLVWDGRRFLLLGAIPPEEPDELSQRVFVSVVLWWDELRKKGRADRVLIFLPAHCSKHLLNSFPRLKLPLVAYEYELKESRLQKIYPPDRHESQVRSPYTIFPYQTDVPPLLREIQRAHACLQLSFRRGRWELSFRGLPVLWWDEAGDRGFFDYVDPRPFCAGNRNRFDMHIQQLIELRSFPPREPAHPYYRLAHERWLESSIVADHSIIDRRLGSEIYAQVPTYLDGERKVLDLLTATAEGRLAVLELKVEKNLDVIFQALDYWERVCYHLKQGDFQRGGYFRARRLLKETPLLYVVSPLFEFHRVLPKIVQYLKPAIDWRCVGINVAWRRELKVLRTFRF